MLTRFFAFLASPRGRILRGLLSVLLIGWLLQMIDWSAMRDLRNTSFSWICALAGLLFALLAYPLCAWRWQKLLAIQGVRLPFTQTHRIVWVGQFYNAFLPGGIGGDASRLTHACLLAPQKLRAIAAATALDRLIGFAVLLALALPATALFNSTSSGQVVTLDLGFWALGAAGAAALLALFFLPQLPAWMPAFVKPWNEQWTAFRRHRPQLPHAIATSMAVWILDFAAGWLLARSIGLQLEITTLSLALITAYLSTLLPISLGGHGLREGTLLFTVALLTNMPADDSRLATFSLLFLLVNLGSSLVGGAILLATTLTPQNASQANPANH